MREYQTAADGEVAREVGAEVSTGVGSATRREVGSTKEMHPAYVLGTSAKSKHDTKKPSQTKEEAFKNLKAFDFAFIRRSNNKWTYSIVSDRTNHMIRFVVDELGRTKTMEREYWGSNIRRVNVRDKHNHHHDHLNDDNHHQECDDHQQQHHEHPSSHQGSDSNNILNGNQDQVQNRYRQIRNPLRSNRSVDDSIVSSITRR